MLPSLVIFDFAGTLIDHGCRAPLGAFLRAFFEVGLPIDEATARRPMGANKRDHILDILAYPELAEPVSKLADAAPREVLAGRIYERFCRYLPDTILTYAEPIPGARECLQWLKTAGIPYAVTTGYTRPMIRPLLPVAEEMGIDLTNIVCADEVAAGRPAPWACFRIAEKLGIFPLGSAIKIGDTPADIAEGLNAGMLSLGVTLSGNETGLTMAQLSSLEPEERASLRVRATRVFRAAGADDVLESVAHLPAWIQKQS